MSKREFVLGNWIDLRCTASGILSRKASVKPFFRPTIYRLVRVKVAQVEVQAAQERKAKKGKA